MARRAAAVASAYAGLAAACDVLELSDGGAVAVTLDLAGWDQQHGRPWYRARGGEGELRFSAAVAEGTAPSSPVPAAKWCLASAPEGSCAWALESWVAAPQHHAAVAPRAQWRRDGTPVRSAVLRCAAGADSTLHWRSSAHPGLAGLYLRAAAGGHEYRRAGSALPGARSLALFPLGRGGAGGWAIAESPEDCKGGGGDCLAVASCPLPANPCHAADAHSWRVARSSGGLMRDDPTAAVTGDEGKGVHRALWGALAKISGLDWQPHGAPVPIPRVGFGTGGALGRSALASPAGPAALAAGYKLFDTAWAYRNEDVVARLLTAPAKLPQSLEGASVTVYSQAGCQGAEQTVTAAAKESECSACWSVCNKKFKGGGPTHGPSGTRVQSLRVRGPGAKVAVYQGCLGFGWGLDRKAESLLGRYGESDGCVDARIEHAEFIASEADQGWELEGESSRDSLFITSKVWFSHLGYARTMVSVAESLAKLRTWYVDHYMLHWADCYPQIPWMSCKTEGAQASGTWRGSWRALERLFAEGVVFSIGLSNFGAEPSAERGSLQEVFDWGVAGPHMLQNHMDPITPDAAAVAWCAEHGTLYQSYAPVLGYAANTWAPYRAVRSVVEGVAARLGKPHMAVLLRWFVQCGVAVIPRSAKPAHIKENYDVVDWSLTEEDWRAITAVVCAENRCGGHPLRMVPDAELSRRFTPAPRRRRPAAAPRPLDAAQRRQGQWGEPSGGAAAGTAAEPSGSSPAWLAAAGGIGAVLAAYYAARRRRSAGAEERAAAAPPRSGHHSNAPRPQPGRDGLVVRAPRDV